MTLLASQDGAMWAFVVIGLVVFIALAIHAAKERK